jgi:hypothetical protein
MLLGLEHGKGKTGMAVNECIWGSDIEIDVPEGSAISIKGKEARTRIDTVRKVTVNMVGGDISVRNVGEGVSAVTYRGGVTVENSQGPMLLESTSGNIVAFGLSPSEIGDTFKAKTSGGTLSLQRLGFRQIEVNSISGSILYAGELLSGGSYAFGTTNGIIRLTIPQATSSIVSAVFGYGNFNSEIPFTTHTEDVGPGPLKRINGRLGKGDNATLKLTTDSGSILIKKQ